MYKHVLFLVLLFVFESHQKNIKRITYEGYKGFAVKGDPKSLTQLKSFAEKFNDHDILYLEAIGKENDYIVSPKFISLFQREAGKHNLNVNIVHDDISKLIHNETKLLSTRFDGFSWNAYHDIDEIYKFLEDMHSKYPNSTKVVTGGQSYEGRPLKGLRIMTPYEEDKEKPAIIIESGIHAREWITPATTTYFINELLTSEDQDMKRLRESYDWHIFPSVNPDGYHYSHTVDRYWRKTRSPAANGCYGADPNRNWDHNWNVHGASNNPCHYQIYAGPKAFSEVETRSFSEYITNVRNLEVYVGVHADAQMLLLPYSDSKEHSDNYDDLVNIGETSLKYGYKVNGEKYDGPATAAEILYPVSGGSMDWVRQELGTPIVFTYELRGRYFHWPQERIPEQGNELTQMLLGLILEAENLGYF